MSPQPPGSPADPPPRPHGYSPQRYHPLGFNAPPGSGPPQGYEAPPGHVPPPGYAAPPGHVPPPGYAVPPGYVSQPNYRPQGYGPPGYGPQRTPQYGPPLDPGAVKPGIIPLRPLTLSDIFNGAVGYIRANPKPTLGLTAAVVIIMQIVTLFAALGPLAAYGNMAADPPEELTEGVVGAWAATAGVGLLVTWLGGVLLSGMLTVVIGRAVFGAPITIGEAWAKVRGRLLALLGLALLEVTGMVALVGLVVVILAAVATAINGAAAILVAFPLVLVVMVVLAYLYTVLLFAPVLIVLEKLSIVDAIARSFALVRNGFWRVFGIRLLTAIVVGFIGTAISAPFSIVGQALMAAAGSTTMLLVGTTLAAVGGGISEIITAPFSAGVVVLLYTDRRIRAEAFDLVLQTGAAGSPAAVESTDNLWLTRPF
ncbi:hypothetical protein [Mycobacterium spongiae]|uniref:DUF7847 domain-containing protein n=1 Tax=Mycobacterium spongiae TaxID=886343 RepID=A0A975PYU8_9MYCO|nr:hypothetical protein [Mycobacterium spongiae]QUR69254.1 hypothetical protein F6B93_21200 [Mycobacterium spongiae]